MPKQPRMRAPRILSRKSPRRGGTGSPSGPERATSRRERRTRASQEGKRAPRRFSRPHHGRTPWCMRLRARSLRGRLRTHVDLVQGVGHDGRLECRVTRTTVDVGARLASEPSSLHGSLARGSEGSRRDPSLRLRSPPSTSLRTRDLPPSQGRSLSKQAVLPIVSGGRIPHARPTQCIETTRALESSDWLRRLVFETWSRSSHLNGSRSQLPRTVEDGEARRERPRRRGWVSGTWRCPPPSHRGNPVQTPRIPRRRSVIASMLAVPFPAPGNPTVRPPPRKRFAHGPGLRFLSPLSSLSLSIGIGLGSVPHRGPLARSSRARSTNARHFLAHRAGKRTGSPVDRGRSCGSEGVERWPWKWRRRTPAGRACRRT